MLTGYSQFKEIIVSIDKSDSKVKGIPFFYNIDEIEKYIETHIFDPVIRISTNNTDIFTDELFNQGFDFIITDNLKEYFKQGNIKTFVKFYHDRGKINLIWSTPKKFLIKDDVKTNIPIKTWLLGMINCKRGK